MIFGITASTASLQGKEPERAAEIRAPQTGKSVCRPKNGFIPELLRDTDLDPETGSLSGCYHDKREETVFSTNDWISYRVSETAYTGGAHEYAEIRVGTVNRRTGNHLFLADIVKKDQEPLLLDAVRAALVKYWELKSPEELEKNFARQAEFDRKFLL